MNKPTKAMIAGAALAGLFAGSVHAATGTTSTNGSTQISKAGSVMGEKKDTNGCAGQNSCKGKGGCKTGDNGCKGKNSCKGKGGCATDGSKKK
jgi:hypothetical protein